MGGAVCFLAGRRMHHNVHAKTGERLCVAKERLDRGGSVRDRCLLCLCCAPVLCCTVVVILCVAGEGLGESFCRQARPAVACNRVRCNCNRGTVGGEWTSIGAAPCWRHALDDARARGGYSDRPQVHQRASQSLYFCLSPPPPPLLSFSSMLSGVILIRGLKLGV